MAILSIQSEVSYGYVGNGIALPALHALGLEVWPVATVAFSNHPGHGRFAGRVRQAAEIAELFGGLDELAVWPACEAVLSGYLGEAGTAAAVAAALDSARRVVPALPYMLDPVIGDHGRVFVRDGVPEAIREHLLPRADVITPNLFELGLLAGATVDADGAVDAARSLIASPAAPRLQAVAVTGIAREATVDSLLVLGDEAWLASVPRRPRGFNGTGDLFAALLAGWWTTTGSLPSAFARTNAGLALATAATWESGGKELDLPRFVCGLRNVVPSPLVRIG